MNRPRWPSVAAFGLAATLAQGATLEEARALFDQRRYEESIEVADRVASGSNAPGQALILATRACNALEDYVRGVEFGKRATAALPDSSTAWFAYTVAVRIKLTKINRVKAIFSAGTYKHSLRKALELDPRNVDARAEEIGFLFNAPGIVGGSKSKAREKIEELKRLDPRRGLFEQAAWEPEQARGIYERLLAEDPSDVTARSRLAGWFASNEDYRAAEGQYRILAESDAVKDDAWESLGVRYQRARVRILGGFEPDQAVELLRGYIEQLPAEATGLPGMASAYWRLGQAREQLGQIEAARAAYQRALELDPEHERAHAALKQDR